MADETTKELLLRAAVEVFAEKTFRDATVAEICDRAGANGAAINYHFGSKDALLKHALKHAFDLAEARYPIRGTLDRSATPEERLRAFLEAVILRSFDPGPAGHFERIVGHMLKFGTGDSDDALGEVRALHGEYLDSIVKRLINTRSKSVIAHARVCVIALAVFQNAVPGVRRSLFPEGVSPAGLRRYVDRQVAFALAGLASLSTKKPTCDPSTISALPVA